MYVNVSVTPSKQFPDQVGAYVTGSTGDRYFSHLVNARGVIPGPGNPGRWKRSDAALC